MLTKSQLPAKLAIAFTAIAVLAPSRNADASILDSISDISGGTTVDFDALGTLNSALIPVGVAAGPNLSNTGFASFVTGNADAPASTRGGFLNPGQSVRFTPLGGASWDAIGVAFFTGNINIPVTLGFNAFDDQNNFLASQAVTATVGSTVAEFNAGARFIGLESATPIAAVVISNQSSSVGLGFDNLTFSFAEPDGGAVPEPTMLMTWAGLAFCGVSIARRRPPVFASPRSRPPS